MTYTYVFITDDLDAVNLATSLREDLLQESLVYALIQVANIERFGVLVRLEGWSSCS